MTKTSLTRPALGAAVSVVLVVVAAWLVTRGASGGSSTDAGAVPGRDYPVTLYTHCGIDIIEFDGRRWQAERAVSDPGGRPDPATLGVTVYDGTTPGVLRLLADDTLRFTAAAPGPVVLFHPTSVTVPICQ